MEPNSPEPSMEDILASIKRIIAEDGAAPRDTPAKPRRQPISFAELPDDAPAEDDGTVQSPFATPEDGQDESVLELTGAIGEPASEAAPDDAAEGVLPAATGGATPAKLVSPDAETASRQAIAALSAMVVTPAAQADNSLEGLVREMLRPMLKEWLDARLPDIVERIVALEISRITSRDP